MKEVQTRRLTAIDCPRSSFAAPDATSRDPATPARSQEVPDSASERAQTRPGQNEPGRLAANLRIWPARRQQHLREQQVSHISSHEASKEKGGRCGRPASTIEQKASEIAYQDCSCQLGGYNLSSSSFSSSVSGEMPSRSAKRQGPHINDVGSLLCCSPIAWPSSCAIVS
jgi:hypothetical protein